uniref:NAB domain-containing protein n=1 Tax=Arundo donax TaxID=35708 RepID=A0A0A9E736_ARUDO
MLKLIDQDADSFAQRAEMYYKKRPILVDMLGDLYRTHRSLAEQCDLLKHGSGTRHTVFGLSSCTQGRSQAPMNGKPTSRCTSCSVSTYDSESEVDDPEDEEVSETETESSQRPQQDEQVELMRAEIERLKEQNAALQKVAEENVALKAELAEKDDEKREVIRQLASSMDMMREQNSTLRECIKGSTNSSPSSRGLDLKKLAKDLFFVRLFTAHCKAAGPIVAL